MIPYGVAAAFAGFAFLFGVAGGMYLAAMLEEK
jgi:hypothetical protein